ncbi:DUF342 domain-containing protein [Pseudodesulfovibrio cashew]|uniref:DUF342 domain-containing protein n=1 Tax=Pseudodesulfovibrio cashew TaxID=2678688 RepID=A0A6I6JHV6_9BACT|nr:FapA family protein [Pseudodesulfovibrio cashew]QGY40053.1 DUF342 domain-containing protein [Pseudodesulfovibrio cashew]
MAKNNATKQPRDAQFRFAMSEDGMKLGVSRYFPPNGGEGPSVELLKRQLADAGVLLPVDEVAARQVVEGILDQGEIKRLALVNGIPAQEPRDGCLMALGDLEFPVFPGDRFARKREPLQAKPGETIDGRLIKPREDFEPADLKLTMGDNVEFDALSSSYVSQVWGMVRLKDGIISVDLIPVISEDAITVSGTVHHRDFKGRAVTVAQIEKELRDLGVVIDIDTDRLDALLKKAAALGKPVPDEVLASGAYPVPGKDGWFEFLVSSRETAGIEDEAGRLDFRNRGTYPMVNLGQVIGRLHAPTAGEGGIDIYGKTIPAHAGRELHVHKGQGVQVLDDKVTYTASAEGVVSMEKGTLSVTDCLIISGDVDISTGNVEVERGSVKILGSVQAGAVVSAPKHVIVAGSVESATVTAGGDVVVSGGILMPEGGTVRAENDVLAGYATNARIIAGRDVEIANDTTNSRIQAEGRFLGTKGKGHVQGGEIITSKGMEINEVGSELGVDTRITVRIDHADDSALREERQKIKVAISRIDEAIGTDPVEAILSRTPAEKRPAVAEVIKHRNALIRRRKDIADRITRLMLERQEELAGVKVKVKRLLHPGTMIRFGGKSFNITKRTEASTIYWSERDRDIVIE